MGRPYWFRLGQAGLRRGGSGMVQAVKDFVRPPPVPPAGLAVSKGLPAVAQMQKYLGLSQQVARSPVKGGGSFEVGDGGSVVAEMVAGVSEAVQRRRLAVPVAGAAMQFERLGAVPQRPVVSAQQRV